MSIMKQIRITQAVVLVAGLIIVWGDFEFSTKFAALMIWMVVSNVLLLRLKCSKCSKRLAMMPPYFVRSFGLSKCAYCDFDHSRESGGKPPSEVGS